MFACINYTPNKPQLLEVSDFEEVFFGLRPNFRKSETFKRSSKVRDFAELELSMLN